MTPRRALFGYGSQAQLMVQAAIRAYQYLDLSVLPVPPDEAGVAASGKLELTGTATGAVWSPLTIADTSVAVAAASQDTAQNVLDELAAALNAEQSLPVSATVVTPEDPDGEGEQVAPPPLSDPDRQKQRAPSATRSRCPPAARLPA